MVWWIHVGILLGTVLATSNASAQPLEAASPSIDAGVFIGGNYFSDDIELGNASFSDQVPQSAPLVGLRLSYALLPDIAPGSALGPHLTLELETKLAFSSTDEVPEMMRDSHFSPVLGWRAQLIFGLRQSRSLRPFAVLGAGAETAFSRSPFASDVDTDTAVHWGLGAVYAMTPRYGLRADLRHGITAGREKFGASTLEFHTGFYYSFGMGGGSTGQAARSAQPDGTTSVETVPMDTSQEPTAPADADGDGIPDFTDACPEVAETVNDVEDDDGCPEANVDRDNDGLAGAADRCPNTAEDMDGFEDEDGCPETDNDKDGLPDTSDGCPMKPENLNGFEDDDGCPDEFPPQLKEITGAIQGLRFRGGGARLLARSNRSLDRLTTILRGYPSVRIKLTGHTNDRGKPEKNLALSQQRAEAVKAYLVGKGIDAGRIDTAGAGAERPVASNASRRGRAKNQRVELELVAPTPEAPTPETPTPEASGESPAP